MDPGGSCQRTRAPLSIDLDGEHAVHVVPVQETPTIRSRSRPSQWQFVGREDGRAEQQSRGCCAHPKLFGSLAHSCVMFFRLRKNPTCKDSELRTEVTGRIARLVGDRGSVHVSSRVAGVLVPDAGGIEGSDAI